MQLSSSADPSPTSDEQIIVHRLREQGWTDEGLATIHFLKVDINRPFEDWLVFWDARYGPAYVPLLRAHAFFKVRRHLADLGPGNERAGFRFVSGVIAEPFLALGFRRHVAQAATAAKPRGKLADGSRMSEVIGRLANSPEHRELTAKELWPHFLSALEERGLDPNELHPADPRQTCVQYDSNSKLNKTASMTRRSFCNAVSRARNPKS